MINQEDYEDYKDKIKELRRIIYDLIFAYENKDMDSPHEFEFEAIRAGIREVGTPMELKFCLGVLDRMNNKNTIMKLAKEIGEGHE